MLSVEDWITIRELNRRGVSVSEIARQTGHDWKTVRKAVEASVPQLTRKPAEGRASKLDPFREYLAQRVAEGCLNGSVLLEELRQRGYTGKISILRGILTPLRQEQRRAREATERFETGPGKQAQVDWGEFGKIWVPREERWRKLYGFVFTLGYSRAQYLEFVVSCDTEHFLKCHLGAFAALGIPETVLYDNLKTGIVGRRPDGTPILPGRFADFALTYGFTPRFCQPYRPRTKGKVERTVSYVRQNFWVRVGADVVNQDLALAGLNDRAREWVATVANVRVHGTHGEVVARRYADEEPLLGKLTGRPLYDTAYHAFRQVSRDGRVSYGGQLYQVPLSHALTEVEVIETLDGQVTLRAKGGQALSRSLVMTSDREAARSEQTLPVGHPATLGRAPRLRLVECAPPVVETRDLAVYEEVARAVGGS